MEAVTKSSCLMVLQVVCPAKCMQELDHRSDRCSALCNAAPAAAPSYLHSPLWAALRCCAARTQALAAFILPL